MNDTTGPADAAEILALDEAYGRAMVAADTAALEPLLAEDVTFTHATGTVEDKAGQLRRVGRVRYHRYGTRDRVARRYGDAAVLTGTLAFSIQPPGAAQANDVELLVTQVWARSDGRWRLVAFHACRPAAAGAH
jgi:ketosteroid isomerase-like protein